MNPNIKAKSQALKDLKEEFSTVLAEEDVIDSERHYTKPSKSNPPNKWTDIFNPKDEETSDLFIEDTGLEESEDNIIE